jgi:hypothetical protein
MCIRDRQRPLSATYARAGQLGLGKSAAFNASPASGRLRREHCRRPWTAEEDESLRVRYADESTAALASSLGRSLPATYNRAKKLGLVKSASYLASPAACRLRREATPASIATRFKPGQVPANKGVKRPGWAPGRMRETQFKAGERRGVATRLWKPVGTERVSKDGYLERKVNDDLPLQARWRAVHLIEWEAIHGRIPAGHALVFKNGDKRDIRLDNLELITRAALMRRNTIHNLPQPLVETIQLLGRVTRTIRRKTRVE